METAGKLVDDEELKEAMKERGLGTPATRAAIIETLLKRNYISRTKKTLTATDLGRYLIALVRDPNLKSPELTGQWEAKLKQIEAGNLKPNNFMDEIARYTHDVIHTCDENPINLDKFGSCPQCGREVIKGKHDYGCSGWREGCSFVLRSRFGDNELKIEVIRELLQRGSLRNPFDALGNQTTILALTESGAVVDIPVPCAGDQNSNGKRSIGPQGGNASRASGATSDTSLGKCPLCNANVVEQKKSFSCSGWKAGCKFAIWKSIAGKRIGKRIAQTLLKKGKTSELKGFKSKAGKPFNAKLKLTDGAVKFEFDT